MKNSVFVSIATLALGLGVSAMPANTNIAREAAVDGNNVEKRAQVCVFVGTDANWGGLTSNQCAAPGVCCE